MPGKAPHEKPIVVPDGLEVQCPRNHLIGHIRGHIREGKAPNINRIRFVAGQGQMPGELPLCRICGMPYLQDGNVRTKEGWTPRAPASIERPLPGAIRRKQRRET